MRRQLGTLFVALTVGLSASTALAASPGAAGNAAATTEAVASTSSVLRQAGTTAQGALLRAIARRAIVTSAPRMNSVVSIASAVEFRTVSLSSLPVSARSLGQRWNRLVVDGELAQAERAAIRNASAITQILRASAAARSTNRTAGVDGDPVYCANGALVGIAVLEFILIVDANVLQYCVHWYPGNPACWTWVIVPDETVVLFSAEWDINCLLLP